MARKSKLLAALHAHKGRDIEAEKKQKQIKAAEKRKREKAARKAEEDAASDEGDEKGVKDTDGEQGDFATFSDLDDGPDTGDSQQPATGIENGALPDEEDDESDTDEDNEPKEDSDVALSDLSASELDDTIPHQRLTINNGSALLASQSRIALLRKQPKGTKTPFHIHNSLISSLPPSTTAIPDINDDLTRELEFYRIARTAALSARSILKAESIPFTRPADYFAEMVKSNSHMERITNKMRAEAAEKKGRQEARQQRDARKFGKQVQIAKEQERARGKREMLDKVKDLKRKRKGNAASSEDVRENPDDDMFESINVEAPGAKSSSGRERGPGEETGRRGTSRGGTSRDGPRFKRQKKDAKFGFGGKKRFGKSGDASSSGDMRGFSAGRMKGRGGRGGGGGGARGGRGGGARGRGANSQRLGKSRREAMR